MFSFVHQEKSKNIHFSQICSFKFWIGTKNLFLILRSISKSSWEILHEYIHTYTYYRCLIAVIRNDSVWCDSSGQNFTYI